MSEDFNWEDEESICVEKNDATAIYFNPHGSVVIRQQDEFNDSDQIVIIPLDQLTKVIEKLVTLNNEH